MPHDLEIRTIADLERVLDENPDIRESIRRKLLTDEERALPRIVGQLAEEVRRLTQTVADGFAEAAADRAAMKESIQRLEEGHKRLEDNQNNMYGLLLEQTAARRLPPRISQEFRLSRARVLQSTYVSLPDELVDTLYQAAQEGTISPEDADAVMVADFIMSGVPRGTGPDGSAITYVLAEVSGTLNHHDITRAKERAAALQAATGRPAIPTAAATVIPEPQRTRAEAESVRLFLLDRQ